jgi:hypothetical protein
MTQTDEEQVSTEEIKSIPQLNSLNDPGAITDSDNKAEKEADAIARGDLDKIEERNEHGRREGVRNELIFCARWLIRSVGILSIISIVIFSLHYLLPKSWHWLDQDQLSSLQTFLFSGAVVGAASKFSTRYW